MTTGNHALRSGCYRLARGVRIVSEAGNNGDGGRETAVAICDYPLRIVRLKTVAARLLSLCASERSSEELARLMHISAKQVEALCNQLWRKHLLELGPLRPSVSWPTVSIVIPSYNRAPELERCLHSLLTLEYPVRCLEIIVVDDCSTDGTAAMVQRISEVEGKAIRLVRHEKRQGVALSRNTGAAWACHEIIAYIDSDCVASPRWLAELVPAFQDPHIAIVGGMIRAYECRSMLGRYEDKCSSLFMGERAQQVCLEGPLTYLPTANMLVRRTIWQRLAGFAALTFGEDVDFCRRVLLSGAHILYLPQGVVYHDYRTSLRSFLSIRVAYASSEAVLLLRQAIDRRALLLPPQQASFASAAIGATSGLAATLWHTVTSTVGRKPRVIGKSCFQHSSSLVFIIASMVIMLILTIFATRSRLRKVRELRVSLGPFTIFKATLRGHLAYTYHLCRHLTRYYTLPLLLVSMLIPPLFAFAVVLCAVVIVVDYVRLCPPMAIWEYALCSLLDDCAYEVGVLLGCIRCRTWKPLLPVIKKQSS